MRNENKESLNKKDLSVKTLELQNYFRSNIPVADFMNFKVEDLKPYSVKLSAPLKPNYNHYMTAFGGSIATLGILAGWAILHFKTVEEKIRCVLVIQESNMKYLRPSNNDFEAVSDSLDEKQWDDFKSKLLSDGKAKISMMTNLYSEGKLIATHKGTFVGIAKEK